jgi:biotin-dependent carboxylase-like uncharacterized protein
VSIVIRRAPAFATVQDIGREGSRASGVPRSGAMDVAALQTLNALIANEPSAAAIEIALTGGELEFTEATVFAIGGAECDAQLDGNDIESYRVYRALTGSTLTIKGIATGRFAYVVIAGGLNVPQLMKSSSTYVPGAFGGYEGRRLRNGDTLDVRSDSARRKRIVMDRLPSQLHPPAHDTTRIVVRESPEILLDSEWRISSACDRTGYRLDGTATLFGASVLSEPVCPGVIQLPPSGEPIILMADAPTVGGYRILATVISSDLGSLSQMTQGTTMQFESVSVETAQRAAIENAERIQSVKAWARA